MKILLDTHVWLWWLTEPERLPRPVHEALEDGENPLYLSVVSSWEIAIKYTVGKLLLPEPPAEFVEKRLSRDGLQTLHIEHRHALSVAGLPLYHHDPFDRLLVAQAKNESMILATVDSKIKVYDVEVL